jgi:hypothetical protein
MKAASGVALDVAATNVAESTATTGAMSAMGPSRVKGDTAQRPGPSEMRSHTLAMATEEVGRTSPNAATGDYPSWWSGACDDGHYYSATTWWHHSVALGPNYLGMPACGPLPNHVAWPDYQATFYPGAVTQVAEFECVELTKRFLYLTYHTGPYAANGNQMVQNYTSAVPGYQPFLAKVQNGTVGQAPQPGDILELGQGTAFGHTAIATSSSVDFNGNGTIWVIEENGAASGSEPWTVSGWWVQGSVYAVNEWLHLQSINLTSTNLSFSVPQGSGGSQSGPTAYLSGNYTWEIRVTGSAGNFTYKYWAPGTNALFLAPDPYYTTTINLVGSGTAYQFYGTVCGQSQGCATLSWGPITLGGDNYTAWSQLYRT